MTESTENDPDALENEPDALLKVPPVQQREGDGPEDLIKATEQMRDEREEAMKEMDPDTDG